MFYYKARSPSGYGEVGRGSFASMPILKIFSVSGHNYIITLFLVSDVQNIATYDV